MIINKRMVIRMKCNLVNTESCYNGVTVKLSNGIRTTTLQTQRTNDMVDDLRLNVANGKR